MCIAGKAFHSALSKNTIYTTFKNGGFLNHRKKGKRKVSEQSENYDIELEISKEWTAHK